MFLICLKTLCASGRWYATACLLAACLLPAQAWAQGQATDSPPPGSPAPAEEPLDLPSTFDGPPPPVPPAVVSRDDSGKATVRAVRLATPLQIDGRLDEVLYDTVPPISDFLQVEPRPGEPATDRTEVWITFDETTVFVSLRCWQDPDRIAANDMRRDSYSQDDYFDIALDTFHDGRNAAVFTVYASGGRFDAQITDESQMNMDWNPVWDLRTGRFEGGWTAEAAIPFRSLRYRPGRAQIWGVNFQRYTQWKNESSTLNRIPVALGTMGIMQMSLAGPLVGLEAPPASRNIEIKPYLVADMESDRLANPEISNEVNADLGVDVKVGLSQNLTADFTYNTDFAQVEADQQQVDLTRFSLFFPEKRDFFLENQGTFGFGGAGGGGFGGGFDTPSLFYSRRIGLHQGRVVPIEGGARLTGRAGRYTLGMLNIQSDDEPLSGAIATNFGVMRLKRDILRRSSVGVIYTRRSIDQSGAGRNEAYGVDGTFAFFDDLTFNTYWAETSTPGLEDDDASYRLRMDYNGDRYGVRLERLRVGSHFNPGIGFVRRHDMRRSYGDFRFSPRPADSKLVRKYSWTGSMAYIENGAGMVETREAEGEFGIEFHSGDDVELKYVRSYEFLPFPFPIASDITLGVGGYDFDYVQAELQLGPQRRLSGQFVLEYGDFYSGRKTSFGWGWGRVNLTSQFLLEPTISFNRVELPEGDFDVELVDLRAVYTITPRMFVSALFQYESETRGLAANVRLRWEYRPGSELFVVYNEQRDTLTQGFPGLNNSALIVKVTRLFQR
ncbi:MAG: carbohydrate binding family 9 domain-containing protein [Acidobacteria bacterium]|nr:carbohydrate binding family 9 domain-containing protein [Acidobacteriota bacterium]